MYPIEQWELSSGYPRRVFPDIGWDEPGAVAALQQNAAVRSMIGPVEAYEAAQAIVAETLMSMGLPKLTLN